MLKTEAAVTQDTDAVLALKSLLRLTLRVFIADGRIFLGTFAGTDKSLNLLLVNTEEFRLGPSDNPDGRYVGQVMIPWRLVIKTEVQTPGTSVMDQEEDERMYL
ncbi:hypothetical protein EVG20_g1785 [Dentipellis fragilis]|uniref:Sm domain-containing protein n=1 Tax=Dentipellis fragilis TaxID=205917 RepID=A0A4Y9Z8X4_9AGAM|nr:hypothetical protein EVG20_g1785 [Dentipellis fragilis]